jgi:glutathione synthase/RimK-type ligase-like ATP-grasp enzyme
VSAAGYKPEQLARARRFGFRVPPTLVTTEPAAGLAFCEAQDWAVVAKPVGHGEILGSTESDDRIVFTNLITKEDLARIQSVASCPTLFQRAISKDIDLRVTIVGNDVIAVALHSQDRAVSRVDCRRDNKDGMSDTIVDLPDSLRVRVLELVRSYGLLFAAVDLVVDVGGEYWFLELNPAGQWAWLEQMVDAPISAAILRCLTSPK